jgi:hypothetical protein
MCSPMVSFGVEVARVDDRACLSCERAQWHPRLGVVDGPSPSGVRSAFACPGVSEWSLTGRPTTSYAQTRSVANANCGSKTSQLRSSACAGCDLSGSKNQGASSCQRKSVCGMAGTVVHRHLLEIERTHPLKACDIDTVLLGI